MTATTTAPASIGAQLIAEERARQVTEEGCTPAHDALHTFQELALAAAAYATPEGDREYRWLFETDAPDPHEHTGVVREPVHAFPCESATPRRWPWSEEWWKPTPDDRIRELVKAGALIAAEIDRLLPAPEARYFDGEMSAALETWLGDAFESWLPSTRQLIVRSPDGERVVDAGQWITQDGRQGVTPGPCGDPDCPVLHADPSNPIHPPADRED